MALFPLFGSTLWILRLEQGLYFGLVVLSLNLLVGTAGMVTFGHAMFMGIGAYAVAIPFRDHNINPLYLLALTPAAGALAALITGVIIIRSQALYFSLLTLGVAPAVLGGRARLAELHRRDERHHGRLHPGLAQLDHAPEQPLLVHLRLHAPVHGPAST